MTRVQFAACLCLIVCPAAAAGGERPSPEFAKAKGVADANMKSRAGQRYDQSLNAHFEANTATVMQDCFKKTAKPDVRSFELVFRLTKAGDVQELLVWPETNIGTCFRDGLKGSRLPSPPAENYWALLEMRLAP